MNVYLQEKQSVSLNLKSCLFPIVYSRSGSGQDPVFRGSCDPYGQTPKPETLNPQPYTLNPTLYTLQILPYTKHQTPNTKHQTPNTKPHNPHTKHQTPNTRHDRHTAEQFWWQVFCITRAGGSCFAALAFYAGCVERMRFCIPLWNDFISEHTGICPDQKA